MTDTGPLRTQTLRAGDAFCFKYLCHNLICVRMRRSIVMLNGFFVGDFPERGSSDLNTVRSLTVQSRVPVVTNIALVLTQGVNKPLHQDSQTRIAFVLKYKGKFMDAESQKLYDSLPNKGPDHPHVKVHTRYSRKEYVSKDDQGVWGNWQNGFINACQDYVHLWAIPKDAVIRMRPAGRCMDNEEVILVEYH
jgi:hypothetical protein